MLEASWDKYVENEVKTTNLGALLISFILLANLTKNGSQ